MVQLSPSFFLRFPLKHDFLVRSYFYCVARINPCQNILSSCVKDFINKVTQRRAFSGIYYEKSLAGLICNNTWAQFILCPTWREVKNCQNLNHNQRSARVSMESQYRHLLPSLDWSRSRHPSNFPVSMSLGLDISEISQSR